MIGARYGVILGLGAALMFADKNLSVLTKLGIIGAGWLVTGGYETVYIVCKTLPRDLKAVQKMLQLVIGTKIAEINDMTVPKIFYNTVQRCPNKILFYFKDEEWTFQQVEDYSNRVAHMFLQEGYSKGDTVAVFMENCPEFVCTWLGLAKIGVVPALINYNLRQESLYHSISVAGCKAVVFSSSLSGAVSDIFSMLLNGKRVCYPTFYTGETANGSFVHVPGSRNMDELSRKQSMKPVAKTIQDSIHFKDRLMYIYTSGTTGMPKAAVIKHARYILASRGLTSIIGVKKSDILYCPLPLYHSVGGMISLSGCMSSGISMVLRDKFSASQYFQDCARYRVTVAQYIGELCRYLLATNPSEKDTGHNVRLMFGNGLRPDIWTEFTERFNIPNISEFYGATEGNSNIINFDNTVGAVGFVPVLFSGILPLGLIKVDEDGNPIRNSETGLCIRCDVGEPGEFVGIIQQNHPVREFSGYSDKESTNKKILRDVWSKGDICFRSGDILVSDKFGYLYFRDRKGDTFRWKGENVSTAEVEAVISRVTGLSDVVVYGVTVAGCEGRAGMATLAQNIQSPLDMDSLAKDITTKLPVYARPYFLRLTEKLDITGTYKLKKRDLQLQGFDPDKIEDPMYFLDMKKCQYQELDSELFTKINSGKVRF